MVSGNSQAPLMSVSGDRFSVFICSLPLVSFASCVVIALVWHFDETTSTHCKVSIILKIYGR